MTRIPGIFGSGQAPALARFARAYLHEDFMVEYGSAAGAAAAFRADASADERQALARDFARLATEAATWTLDDLKAFARDELRCAWQPSSMDDLAVLVSAAVSDR